MGRRCLIVTIIGRVQSYMSRPEVKGYVASPGLRLDPVHTWTLAEFGSRYRRSLGMTELRYGPRIDLFTTTHQRSVDLGPDGIIHNVQQCAQTFHIVAISDHGRGSSCAARRAGRGRRVPAS